MGKWFWGNGIGERVLGKGYSEKDKEERLRVKLYCRKIIKKKVMGSNEREFVAIVQPITGGKAPAAPPITMFWGVFLLSQIV